MQPAFLQLTAQDLIQRFGSDLAHVVVVFPSRRARLFFNNYLYQCLQKPVWAPQYLTIDELFAGTSQLQIADNILLITELYNVYTYVYNKEAEKPSTETLDEFYFFGEILLSDFDDVDKQLVNARSLFSNMENLDDLRDDFSHLNKEQIEAVAHYFQDTFLGKTKLQETFGSIWHILGKVYFAFKERLREKGIAYPGMQMRDAIEGSDSFPSHDRKTYVFAGFNVLNQCEKSLFKHLKEQSLFYWDFDKYYIGENIEAGRFISENIQQFGSALDKKQFDYFTHPDKKITIVASPSESGQSAYISPWIKSLQKEHFIAPDTAIVLCNEQILPTVMHAIPPQQVEDVNITMGFPITQAPICSFLQVLTEMQVLGVVQSGQAFRYKYVLPVLRHPYTQSLFPEAKEVEKKINEENIFFPTQEILLGNPLFIWAENTLQLAEYLLHTTQQAGIIFKESTEQTDIYSGLYQESIFRAYQIINRLLDLVKSGELQVERNTFLRLLKKLLSTTKVPFHGEPVKGLQIMGVLETRTLDFKNIILISTNEGYMPSTSNDNTFIPQFLRTHFGLSTIEHQDSVYAYYFYRLLQRAENITLVYNTDKTQLGKAEISRFLLQLLIDKRLTIRRYNLSSSIKPIQSETIEVAKTPALTAKIRQQYDINISPEAHTLSPSALNNFIDCSLRFYLQYIEGMKNREELSDELDSSIFGTIFHRAAELLYREIGGIKDLKQFNPFPVQKEHLTPYLKKDSMLLNKIISRAFEEKYFQKQGVNMKQYNGEQLINFRVIRHLMLRMIAFDIKQTPFYIKGLEYPVHTTFHLPDTGITLKVGGIIDRLDEQERGLCIIDYKTSGQGKPYKEICDLFVQSDRRASHIFQTFIYASALVKNEAQKPVAPALLYLQEAGKDDYSPIITYQKEDIIDFSKLMPEFDALFTDKIQELFDPNIPFRQTEAQKNCAYCDFKELCNRG